MPFSPKENANASKKPDKYDQTYSSVGEMFQSLADTPEEKQFADELQANLSKRVLAHYLFAARSARNVSQKHIADHIGCSQSRISKLEGSLDSEWSVGDVEGYLAALNLKGQLFVSRRDATLFDEIKSHAFRIRDCLHEMVRMAGDDHVIGQGVSKAHIETMANLCGFIVTSLKDLPNFRGHLSPIVDAEDSTPPKPPFTEPCSTQVA